MSKYVVKTKELDTFDGMSIERVLKSNISRYSKDDMLLVNGDDITNFGNKTDVEYIKNWSKGYISSIKKNNG